jgi:hypothetical protein
LMSKWLVLNQHPLPSRGLKWSGFASLANRK